MLHSILNALHSRSARARAVAELRRFHEAELRELGVSDEQLKAFLSGR